MLQTDNIIQLGNELMTKVSNDRVSSLKKDMQTGLNYYDAKHDILDYRLFYFDNEGKLKEETNRSNTKIAHAFFTELVDQKVQYLLSNPIEVKTEQDGLQELLDDYIDEDFQLMLQEMVEGSSQKSIEYVFWKVNADGKIEFKTADAQRIIPIYDENYEVSQLIYYFDDEIVVGDTVKTVTKMQLWTTEDVYYFVTIDGKTKLDESIGLNPVKHQLRKKGDVIEGKGYGRVPFILFENNKRKTNDLKRIKDLIDDYDLMACSLSNNLIDFDNPIFVVRGFEGDSLDTLTTNLRSRKTVGVGDEGGIDVKTVDIPVEARKTKLAIDKEAIYKFGMGFDSSQVGDGNITNVVIKSRYSLLDLKCNHTEIRLRQVLKQMLELIIENINSLNGKNYNTTDLEISIVRDVMANEVDNANIAKIEADTKQVLIGNIMTAAPRLDDQTVLNLLADILEVDAEEVQEALGEQGYQGDMNLMTEVLDDRAEQVPAGNRRPAEAVGQDNGQAPV
ncbi:Phage portal protein, SPP1 Gp6-like [Streptococcus parauberis]|uniref:Phage portal protein, SPP1 Gp6-like n=1 Tax=Streptococcus parauberis TaxID=1348 RepID=A0A854WSQ0_9STRE|nr:phage portal protein [Streptococcus parauberis]PCH13877.1 Phage portal protein, SPP1 Gp6-like [Streptococcus parauberis]PCH14143.1 Phage portal protein, SPP1 Gp6-like [Streptococcus parauberis]